MNVSLTPELEAMVQEKVKSGLYNSASEVVRDALRLLRQQDDERQIRLEKLRADINLGLDQLDRGEGVEYESPDAVFEAMDTRLAARKAARQHAKQAA